MPTCPECDGDGIISVDVGSATEQYDHIEGYDEEDEVCPVCDGTGVVDEEPDSSEEEA